jgi:hypothetical protein
MLKKTGIQYVIPLPKSTLQVYWHIKKGLKLITEQNLCLTKCILCYFSLSLDKI